MSSIMSVSVTIGLFFGLLALPATYIGNKSNKKFSDGINFVFSLVTAVLFGAGAWYGSYFILNAFLYVD